MKTDRKTRADELLDQYGQTFAQELGIDISRNTPGALFKLLCAAVLMSTRIGSALAIRGARAIFEKGWTNPERLESVSWSQRTRTLNESGYARYDGRGSTMLAETATILLDKYSGDLRNLRKAAKFNIQEERRLLKEFKGIGDVGADIFFREVQAAWDEVFPFVDKRALSGARKAGLPTDADSLLELAGKEDFVRLVAALVRFDMVKKTKTRTAK